MQEGLSILLQHRASKTHELHEQATKIIRLWKNNNSSLPQENKTNFVLIPPKKAVINRRKKQIEATEKSIDGLVSFRRLEPTAKTCIKEAKQALKRGVKIRIITEKPKNEQSIPKIINDLEKNHSVKLRYLLNPPSAILTIYDGKELLITTSAKTDLGESPALWSNNPSLLSVMNDFYEIMWITAIENLDVQTLKH